MTLKSLALLASRMEELRAYRSYRAALKRGPGFGWKIWFPFFRNAIRHEAQRSWPGGYIRVAEDLVMYVPQEVDASAGYLLLKPYAHEPLVGLLCRSGETVMDIGANLGRWTASAALAVGQSGRVLAIEPISRLANAISKTCLLNRFHWVKVINAAASDKAGEAVFSIEQENSGGSRLGTMQDDPSRTFQQLSVKTTTVDHCVEEEKIESLGLIKIDVEGFESQVIAGARASLRRFSPTLVLETGHESAESREQIAIMLRALDYVIVGVPAGPALVEATWDDYLGRRGVFDRPASFDIVLMVSK